MPSRWISTMLAALAVALGAAGSAAAKGLPLGPAGLTETRSSQRLAPGVVYTQIVRGATTSDEFYVIDVGFTLDRSQADATAASLRSRGYDVRVLAVDDHAPDDPHPGPTGYTARVGHYSTAPDAQATATQIQSQGFGDVHVDYSGDDGGSTGGPWRVHVLEVDPRRFRGSVTPVLANDVVPGRETVSSIEARTGALAGVNGGYFVIGPSDGTPGDLAGISVIGGDLISEAVEGRTDLLLPHPNGRGARVDALGTTMSVRSSDGSTYDLDGRNRKPGLIRACGGDAGDQPTAGPLHDITCTDPNELIQFTPRFGAASDPSSQIEAVLDRRGRVSALRAAGGSIPPEASVLGGTGDGADWLRAHAQPGDRVRVRTTIEDGRHGLGGSPRLGVVNGGPRLLAGGSDAIDAVAEGFTHPGDPEFYYRFAVRRNPRTLAGVTRSGHLLLVAVDGRAPGYSDGLSFLEEAAVMRALGASDALNLDGGGSTTMALGTTLVTRPSDALNLDGGGSTTMALGTTLVTRPSDATGERPVGDAIAVLPGRAGERAQRRPR